jgi:transposase-like protein
MIPRFFRPWAVVTQSAPAIPSKKYPADPRDRALRMAMDRLAENPTPYACVKALGPKLGVGVETLRKWLLQSEIDRGDRSGLTSEELEEIKRLKAESGTA